MMMAMSFIVGTSASTTIWSSESLQKGEKDTSTLPMGASKLKSAVVGLPSTFRGRTSVSGERVPVRPTICTYEWRAALRTLSGLKDTTTSFLAPGDCDEVVMVATVNFAADTSRGISPPVALVMPVAAIGTSPLAEITIVSRLGPAWVYLGLTRSKENVVSASLAMLSPGMTVTTRVPVACFQEARELNFLMSFKDPPVTIIKLRVPSGVSEPTRPEMVMAASLSPVRTNSGLKATVMVLVAPGDVVAALMVLTVKVAECLISRAVLSSFVVSVVGSTMG
mmetsp:Transcript_20804/g.40442  ORF Transcript_20804/g.40442 Transcript_20804/m.40442 type:complete len:280 (+) Transcript_20804:1299-2138(+)